jgi:DNA-binding transcriptional MerR regulator
VPKGHTRRQAAAAAGVSLRTLDLYRKRGIIKGHIQFIEDHGNMRVYTDDDIQLVHAEKLAQRERMAPGLRRYVDPPTEGDTAK